MKLMKRILVESIDMVTDIFDGIARSLKVGEVVRAVYLLPVLTLLFYLLLPFALPVRLYRWCTK